MFAPLLLILAVLSVPVLSREKCDPLDKDERCAPVPAFAGKALFNFTTENSVDEFNNFWSVDDDEIAKCSSEDQGQIDFDADEADDKKIALTLWKEGDAAILTSHRYLFFGKVSVEVQAARGKGVITSIVLKSDSGDEIDWEILGAYEGQAQTNYFHNGKALYNTYNDTHPIDASVFSQPHTYTVEWTHRSLIFSIDGIERKTWLVGEIPPERWPQTPMHIELRTWAVGGEGHRDPGLIAWAGGLPAWDREAPFRAYYRWVEAEDYTGYACGRVDGPVEYSYDERMRGWRDVGVGGGCWQRPELPESAETPSAPPPGRPETTRKDDGEEPASETCTCGGGSATLGGVWWVSVTLVLMGWTVVV